MNTIASLKIPHWAILVITISLLIIAEIMREQNAGIINLPVAAVGLLGTLQAILGLFSDSVPTAVRARLAARAAKVGGLAILAFATFSCSGAQQSQVESAGISLTECALSNFVPCLVANVANYQSCLEKTAVACGSDVATIATIYAAHESAEIKEGKTPLVPLDSDGGLSPEKARIK